MNFRTDLALEQREAIGETDTRGIICETKETESAKITKIEVVDEEGARALGKPIGKYITVEVKPFSKTAQLLDGRLDAVAEALMTLLPGEGSVLVAGLGNDQITPDALGPKCCEMILATRHIGGEIARSAGLGDLRPVAAVTPGVLGRTGIETGEILAGIVSSAKPAAVVTVDALAARKLSRLGCTVQLADTGVTPGSGVGNARREINEKNLGVPVIAVGVPTVVDAATLVADLTDGDSDGGEDARMMMITPREIDLLVGRAAALIAMSINIALQPHIAPEDMLMLVGQ